VFAVYDRRKTVSLGAAIAETWGPRRQRVRPSSRTECDRFRHPSCLRVGGRRHDGHWEALRRRSKRGIRDQRERADCGLGSGAGRQGRSEEKQPDVTSTSWVPLAWYVRRLLTS